MLIRILSFMKMKSLDNEENFIILFIQDHYLVIKNIIINDATDKIIENIKDIMKNILKIYF